MQSRQPKTICSFFNTAELLAYTWIWSKHNDNSAFFLEYEKTHNMEPTLPQFRIILALSKTFNGIYKYLLRPQLLENSVSFASITYCFKNWLEIITPYLLSSFVHNGCPYIICFFRTNLNILISKFISLKNAVDALCYKYLWTSG